MLRMIFIFGGKVSFVYCTCPQGGQCINIRDFLRTLHLDVDYNLSRHFFCAEIPV